MRVRTVVAAVLACTTLASAQPGADLPPPEEEPPPPVSVEAPPGTTLPPINITITNNNNGNNSNTNSQTNEQTSSQTNEQTNSQANPQTNTQTNEQTNTVPVTVTTSVNAAPGAVAPIEAPRAVVGRYEVFRPHRTTQRWITLGVSREGVRGSVDLLGRRRFTLGVAATIGHGGHGHGHGHGHDGGGDDHDRGGRPSGGAIVYLAYTRKLGRFDLRASLGVGVGTRGDDDRDGRRDEAVARTTTPEEIDDDGDRRHRRIAPRAEAAILIGLPLTKRLGLLAGPVISTSGHGRGDGDGHHDKPEVTKSVMAGLRLRF